MSVRILAIDQGSKACGVAYLEGDKVMATDLIRPRAARPWAERMDYVAEAITGRRAIGWMPDIVAIEAVVIWKNVKVALVMGETRGYLFRVIRETWPLARIMDINPAETKAAVGAGRTRDAAKARTQLVVEAMTGLAGLGEDESDAVAIAWAARTKLERERLERMAEDQAVQVELR